MANTIQIKRSTGSSAPSSLSIGELAYTISTESGTASDLGDRLFIGDGSSVIVIGGEFYKKMLDHTAGTLTELSAIVVDSDSKIDHLIVDNIDINGNAITSTDLNGNITITPNGSGDVVIDGLVHPQADGSAGQFLKTDGSGNLDFATVVSTLTLSADSGSDDIISTGETLTFTGGEGIDTAVSDNIITIAGEDASTTNKGIASFATADFTVASGAVSLDDDILRAITTDSGAITMAGHAISVLGGEGLNVTHSGTAITVAGEDASTTNKGIASFAEADFADSSGVITIKALGVSNAQLAGSIANAKLANDGITIGSTDTSLGDTITDLSGITSLVVDDLTIDGSVISTTIDSNTNISLTPDGTGTVTVPSGYAGRTGFTSDSLVNKTYVDSVATGLDVKKSVRVATAAALAASTYHNGNGTLTANANGALSVDGVAVAIDDRVLVKDQAAALQNGFYKVTATGGAGAAFVLTRSPDADAASELTAGAFTFAEEGTDNGDNGYVLSTDGAITLGTTAITFEQFSGAGQITAGNGLTKTGNTIDAVGTTDRISVVADAIDIASGYIGQSSIITLGTIGTGTWQGDTVSTGYGGTGIASFTAGDIMYASGDTTISKLAKGTAGQILNMNSGATAPEWTNTIDGGTF